MKWLLNILGFLVLLAALALLAAPYALVIYFPEQAEYLTGVSHTLVPWIAVLLLFLLFNEGVKTLIASIAAAIGRLKRFSAVGTVAELDTIQGGIQLSLEQLQQISNTITTESQFAWLYFIRYVNSTIYRSQYDFLLVMNQSATKTHEEAHKFYLEFLARKPDDYEYAVESWLKYLTTSQLIQLDPASDTIQLTHHGRVFIAAVQQYGTPNNFLY